MLTAAALAALTSEPWTTGMLVGAPSPAAMPAPPPADVSAVIEVERAGARVRAWVLEPESDPRATVMLLHGIRDTKRSRLGSARQQVRRGRRAVIVDSRGHGESSGRYLTYGVQESRDLSAIVDRLERSGRLTRPLTVVGDSYGAATALLHAAIDARVDSVVASAPFASLREVVPAYLRWMLGPLAAAVPAPWVTRRIERAAVQAGFDPDAACPRCMAPSIRVPVLLIHSRDDERIPYRHSVRIHQALTASRAELLLVDGAGHTGVGRAPAALRRVERWLHQVGTAEGL